VRACGRIGAGRCKARGDSVDAYKARRADDRTRPEAVAWLESEPDY